MGTAARTVEAYIVQMIRSGQYKPGDHISQLPLARRLGLSNNPVIQALRKLEGQGLLERGPDGTARVRGLTVLEMYAALSLREAVEGVAARFCATYATDEELAVFRVRCDKMHQAGENAPLPPDQDMAFHAAIVGFSHARFLQHLYESMDAIRQTFNIQRGASSLSARQVSHEPIIAAVLNRDVATAESEARRHVVAIREAYWSCVTPDDLAAAGVDEAVNGK